MKNIILISILSIMSLITGCASVMKGTTQAIIIDSKPQGAEISIDGAYVGVTPLTITLEKNKKDIITIKKEGYKTVSGELTKSFDPVGIINVFWDLSTTDFITGAAMEYEPNSYFFDLQAKPES